MMNFLIGEVTVVEAADGEGRGEALEGVVVVVLFDILVDVLEFFVAGLEGAAEGKVGVGVELDGDGVIVSGQDGDFVGDAALNHAGAFADNHDAGGQLEPGVDDLLDAMVAAAKDVVELVPSGRAILPL